MADLQQILSDLADALPAIPEAVTAVESAAHELESASRQLAQTLAEMSAPAEAELEELGAHLVAISDASSEEHAHYAELIDGLETAFEIGLESSLNAVALGAGGGTNMRMTYHQASAPTVQLLKDLPVLLREAAEGLAAGLDELSSHTGELHDRLTSEVDTVAGEHAAMESALEAASEELLAAAGALGEAVQEHEQRSASAVDELRAALAELQTDVEARLADLAAAVEEQGHELVASTQQTSALLEVQLTQGAAELVGALVTLAAHTERNEQQANEHHRVLEPVFAALHEFLDPLHSGIDSAKEAAHQAGIEI